jgi:putative hydrolase of the HAD superfamily
VSLKLVTFDVGGVIYQDAVFARAVRLGLSDLGVDITDADFNRIYDEVRQNQAGSIRSKLAAEFLGGAEKKESLLEATDRHWVFTANDLHDDALETLRETRNMGLLVALVANQPASIMGPLREHGVLDLVDFAGISGVVGFEKPDARLFQSALDFLAVAPRDTLHVGNRLDTDVRPAKTLGMKSAWVLRGEAPPAPTAAQLDEPDLVLESLADLTPKLQSMVSR